MGNRILYGRQNFIYENYTCIDPQGDCDVYPEIASRNGAAITHIFETHRNEDYVIGSTELALKTGTEIYHGKALDFK